ncbi:MAG: AAA family ATPase [Planctomycetes bacterium]|nr:AAA family ATPase [Planctomycetota bacterium]
MYAEFFGLRELPFNNTPDPRFFFSTSDHEEALASLVYAVQERKGFVLLTGEVGAGKTLVSRMMLKHFGSQIAFASIHHAIQSGSDLLEALCSEFQLSVEQGASQNTLVHTLHDFLLAEFSKDVPVVLVLDEAQALTVDAFEQLRMIGNLEADDAKLLQIVILGQPELQQRFSSSEFRQLRQRIFRTFHLPAMTRDLTEEYIRHRLTIAGAPHTDFFDRPAIDRIYKHSNGLPRLINTICDNAMLSAYSANCRRMDDEFIENSVAHMMSLGSDHPSREEGPTNTTQQAAGPAPLSRAAGVPDDLLPIVDVFDDGAPTTTNDAALSQRVRAAMLRGMGADAFVVWYQSDMGAEDFPDLVNVEPPIPSVYFEVGGTPPEIIEAGTWASHHSPLFRIDAEASIKKGVEAMTLAALELLSTP